MRPRLWTIWPTPPSPSWSRPTAWPWARAPWYAMTRQEALDAVHSMMEDKVFGESGSRVVIEEFLDRAGGLRPVLYRRKDRGAHGVLHGPQAGAATEIRA